MVSSGRPSVSAVQVALHRLHQTRRVVLALPTFLGALHAVTRSDLAAALPERLVRAAGHGLTVHPMPFEVDRLALHLAWHPRETTNPFHRWLREGIKGSVR